MPYTTWGSVRGCCGHAHDTIDTARACITRDHKGCAAQGGYSDRKVREIDSRDDIDSYDATHGPGVEAESRPSVAISLRLTPEVAEHLRSRPEGARAWIEDRARIEMTPPAE